MLRKVLFIFASDFGPIISFFLAFYFVDFIKATVVLVATTTVVTVISLVLEKRVMWFPVIVTILTASFGSLTVIFDNPEYIIFENTLYNAVVGVLLLGSLAMGKDPLKKIFSDLFAISDRGWFITTRRWGIFMLVSAGVNEIVRIFFTPEFWVHYRFWYLWVVIAFSIWQFSVSRRERTEEANTWGIRIKY